MFKRDVGKRAISSCHSSEEATEGSLSFMLRAFFVERLKNL